MTIELPCSGQPDGYTITEREMDALCVDYPRADVPWQLTAMRDDLLKHPERQGSAGFMEKRVRGWLARALPSARRPDPMRVPMIGAATELHRDLVAGGLIPSDFRPVGTTEREQMGSLRARAQRGASQELQPVDEALTNRFLAALEVHHSEAS